MAGVEKVRMPVPESRPAVALGAAVGIDLLLLVIILIPMAGILLLLTVVPYIGGRFGGRYAYRRMAIRTGALAGAAMMTVLSILVVWALGSLPGENLHLAEPIGLSLLAVGFVLTVLFGARGGSHGGKRSKKDA
jgi:hypothetical protein